MDQIVAGQLANEPEKPEQPTDPRGVISRGGSQGDHRSGTAQAHPQAGEPGGDGPFHRGAPPNGRGTNPTQPMQPGLTPPGMPTPPPQGFGRTPQEQFEQPLPDHPDVRSMPPRRAQFPPSGPSLSVVPPTPEPGKEPEPHREQPPEPPSAELPEPGDERPERTRRSDIMDPRMLRVPYGFAWGDPRTANGKRDNNGHRE